MGAPSPEGALRLSKKHSAGKENAFSSLPLEGKVPSAHTGRMRWKSCFFDESSCFFPRFYFPPHQSASPPASPQGEAFDQHNPLVRQVKQTSLTCSQGRSFRSGLNHFYFSPRAAFTTRPDSSTRAMALGMTISWLNISASSQTRSLDRQEPRKMNPMAMTE